MGPDDRQSALFLSICQPGNERIPVCSALRIAVMVKRFLQKVLSGFYISAGKVCNHAVILTVIDDGFRYEFFRHTIPPQ